MESNWFKSFKDAVKESQKLNAFGYLYDKSFQILDYSILFLIENWDDDDLVKGDNYYYIVGHDGSIGVIESEDLGACWFLTPPDNDNHQEEGEIVLSKEELEELCGLYNTNMTLAVKYVIAKNLCDKDQEMKKESLRLLNESKKDVALRNNDAFQKACERFFGKFGLKFDYRQAYVELETYTVVREYYKTVNIKAYTPQQALSIALDDKKDVFSNETLDYLRTYVDEDDNL